MQARINQLFRLREGEAGMVLILSVLLFSNEMARQMSGIVGISDFINTGGVNGLLLVYIIDSLIIILTGALSSLIVDRFNRVALLRWTAFTFALVFTILRMIATFNVPDQVNAALLFLVSEQQWLVYPAFFWVLANDIFSMAQTKRLFPLIGSWSFVGKVAGIGIAMLPALFFRLGWLSVGALTIETVLLFNILIYLLVFLLSSVGLRKVHLRETVERGETMRETLTEGWGFVREVPSFRYFMIAILAVAFATVVIEFRFLDVSKAAISDPARYQNFYATFRMAMALVSFGIQSFLTSRLIGKIQLKNTFVILPFVMFGSLAAMIASTGIVSGSAAQFVSKVFRNTVDTSARKSFQALVPEERRGRVSLFMDNYVPAGGTILGCVVAGVVVLVGVGFGSTSYFYVYLGITAAVAVFSIWAVLQMHKHYDSSLLNWRLKRRRRGASVLDKLDF